MSGDFTVTYSAGGDLDKLKTVKTIEQINKIKNFPQFTQPYNEMVKLDVPAIPGVYPLSYYTPSDRAAELLAITVTCSGYDENDFYDLFVGNDQWFKNWYCSEVKEGLFLGTSTFVCEVPANTEIRMDFHSVDGTSKKVWLGVRMLVDKTSP